jgi:DNA-binding transcriptional MerR regulator
MTQDNDPSHVSLMLNVRPLIADELTLNECAELTGATTELLERLIEEEIVHTTRTDATERYFDRMEFEIIERSLRLHHELGVNIAGIVIIEHLREQLMASNKHNFKRDVGEARDAGWELVNLS